MSAGVEPILIKGYGKALPGDNGYIGREVNGKEVLAELLAGKTRFIRKKTLSKLEHAIGMIEQKTGIVKRNFSDFSLKFPATYLATGCAVETMKKANVTPDKVEGLYFATDTPDFVFPSQGILIAKILGIKPIQYGNSGMACASIAHTLKEATSDIRDGFCNNALIIAGDVTTRLKLPKNTLEPFLFGDGFVGIFIEKGKRNQRGGFTFTNIFVNPDVSDLFVHLHYYSRELYRGVQRLQFNDNGLDHIGEVDAHEISLQLQDYLNATTDDFPHNVTDEINDSTRIVLPQISKKAVELGIKKFKADVKIDIEPKVVRNAAYNHGNIGAGAVLLSYVEGIESGQVRKDNNVLFDIVGIGGLGTIFKIEPKAKQGFDALRISERLPRPDYRKMIEDKVRHMEDTSRKIIERKKENGDGTKETRVSQFDRISLNRLAATGSNGDTVVLFEPIHTPKQLSRFERVAKSVGSMLRLL